MFIKLESIDFHKDSLVKALLFDSENIARVTKEVINDYYALECKDGNCYFLSKEGFDYLSKILTKEDS